jgi:hypothetical protein
MQYVDRRVSGDTRCLMQQVMHLNFKYASSLHPWLAAIRLAHMRLLAQLLCS